MLKINLICKSNYIDLILTINSLDMINKLFATTLFSILFTIVLGQDVEPQFFNEDASAFANKTYAVVIGISQYENLNDSKQLKWADNDALMVVDYLKTQNNVELYLYTNEDATNPLVIGKKIHEIITKKASSEDNVIIYFSGHGDISVDDNNGYLLLHNVDKPTQTPYSWSDAIPIDKIKNTIINSDINKKNVHLVFDACKSGYAQVPTTGTNFIEHQKIVMMLSSQATQESSEDDELKHGVFTYYLIQGMKGLADLNEGNEITIDELKKYVNKNVSDKTNQEQVPLFAYTDDNQIVSIYTEESLSEANSDVGSNINLAFSGNSKGANEEISSSSSRCNELLNLYKEQASEGFFFQNDIEYTNKPLQIGKPSIIQTFEQPILATQLSRNGKVIGILTGNTINLFAKGDYSHPIPISVAEGTTNFSISNDGLLSISSNGKELQLWNNKTGDLISTHNITEHPITSTEFLSSTKLGITTDNGLYLVWDIKNDQLETHKVANKPIVRSVVDNNTLYALLENQRIVLYDLLNVQYITTLKTKATDFVLNTGNNVLISSNLNTIDQWDLSTYQKRSSITLDKEITSISTDRLEDYLVVGSTNNEIQVINLYNFTLIEEKIKTKHKSENLIYSSYSKSFITTDKSGKLSSFEFENEVQESAINIRQQLMNCYEGQQNKIDEIDGTLVLELNQKVTSVIRKLITSDTTGLTLEDIKNASKYADKAFELGKDHVLDPERLEINKLLLETYEILYEEDKSRYREGIEKVNRILELDPNGSYAYNVAAELHLKLNNTDKAKEILTEAEKVSPNWTKPKIEVSKIYIEEENYEEAKQKIEEVIKLDNENANAYIVMAEAQLGLGNEEAAKENLQKAKSIEADVFVSKTLKRIDDELISENSSQENNQVNQEANKDQNVTVNIVQNVHSEEGLLEPNNPDLRDGLQVGDFYQGGTVFYIDETGKHGLVAAYMSKLEVVNWDQAMTFCLQLELNGFDDWRLPTLGEMRTFSLSPVFLPVTVFWTSIKYHAIPGHVFWYDTRSNVGEYTSKDNKRFMLPVRSF